MDLILYAVPGFFLLIAIELIAEKVRGTAYYRVNDSLTSLATGTINQLINVSKALIPFTVYVAVHQHFAIWNLSASWLNWLVVFVLWDFFYYWNHRLGHEMNILWASHVVHHSSEEYNLTTALRQTGTGFLSFIFYIPLAIVGFDPLMVLSVGALNLIYQFWVHTQHVGKLGWYEWFFVSPSNHRGHHAQNTIYIDKNYGGVFILWDRLFGTYQEEQEDDMPIFGIRGAVQSWNPLWVNAQIYAQLIKDAWRTKHWWYKLTIWFRRTGWRPPDVEEEFPIEKNELEHFSKYDTQVNAWLKCYCIIQYALTATVGIYYSLFAEQMSLGQSAMVVGFVLWATFSIGALMESKQYAGVLEWIRLGVFVSGVVSLMSPTVWANGLLIGIALALPLLVFGRWQNPPSHSNTTVMMETSSKQ